MFSGLFKLLFALSSASPMLLVASLISAFSADGGDIRFPIVIAFSSLVMFIIGGICFIHLANKFGETQRLNESVATVSPSAQWVPVLFGSYFIPLLSCLGSAISLEWVTAIGMIIAVVALIGRDIPPALFLLVAGYRFYELALTNGSGGYKLISKRKAIRDPKTVREVVSLFNNEYWLLEKGI